MTKRTRLRSSVLVTIAVSALTSGIVAAGALPGSRLLSELTSVSSSSGNGGSGDQNTNSSSDGGSNNDSNSNSNSSDNSGQGSNNSQSNDGSTPGTNDCALVTLHCAIGDKSCRMPPTFQKIACDDLQCTSQPTRCVHVKRPVSSSSSDNGGSDNGGSQQSSGNSSEQNSNGPQPVNGGDTNQGNGSQGGPMQMPPVIMPNIPEGMNGSPLGCFAPDGTWTTDRSACDQNQIKHFQQQSSVPNGGNMPEQNPIAPPQPIQNTINQDLGDQKLQQTLDEKFHSQQERDSAYTNLVNAATTALTHIDALSQSSLSPDAATTVSDTQQSIQSLLGTLATGEPTVADVQAAAEAMKSKLQDVQKVIQKTAPAALPKPQVLTDPLDKLLSEIPAIFNFVQAQGVTLPQEAGTEYQTAVTLYLQDKPQCLSNSDACLQMQDVLAHLDTMRTDIQQTLEQSGRADLESQIDQMLQ